MTRQIILDTETTGLNPRQGHRLVEIGCLETINRIPTGKTYHVYINPERNVPREAFNVHGLSEEFLSKKPLFNQVVDDFLSFIKDSMLVIHNVPFDMKFINYELQMLGKSPVPLTQTLCTLEMARKKFPGSPASLDALCKRFKVDNSGRQKHGALIDAELLAEVYIELTGGRQESLNLQMPTTRLQPVNNEQGPRKNSRPSRQYKLKAEELDSHRKLLDQLQNPIWDKLSN